MKATIDENSGFCFGVTYAIEMAEEILDEEGRLYCLGDIVHNDEEVTIPKGEEKPYYAKGEDEKWWVYVRVKDESILASKVMVDVLRRENSKEDVSYEYGSKEKALLDYLNEHPRITLKQYCKMLNLSRWRAQKILVNLVSAGVIRMHNTEKTEFYTL